MKVTILAASISPDAYDIKAIAQMGYDEAKEFFQKDEVKCCNVQEYTIDQTYPHEAKFCADGVSGGDGSDTMINWVKVEENRTVYL